MELAMWFLLAVLGTGSSMGKVWLFPRSYDENTLSTADDKWRIEEIGGQAKREASANVKMAGIDWARITKKLPYQRTPEAKEARKKLFKQFDGFRGNRLLSFAEVDAAIREVLKLDDVFVAKPAIKRAFQVAKDVVKPKSSDPNAKIRNEYIEFREFRFFLQSLRQYFEYYVAFERCDASNDDRISLVEFVDAKAMIEKWGVGPIDAEKVFKDIDTNGGGKILFDEFCDWAIKKNLDLEDDDDAPVSV